MIKLIKQTANTAILMFDHPTKKVNTLSMEVMRQFHELIHQIKADSSIEFLLLKSNKPGIFIAGADIAEIQSISSGEDMMQLLKKANGIIHDFTVLNCTTIAIIDGACLGGGCELALACDFRMASLDDKTQIGLPEVNLGIIPGFGGTQRLSRLIGISLSLSIILKGKPVSSKKAFKLGVVDQCYPKVFEQQYINSFIALVSTRKKRLAVRKKRPYSLFTKIIDRFFMYKFLVSFVSKNTIYKASKGHYPAPLHALKAVLSGRGRSLKRGIELESDLFLKSFETKVSKSLISLFFSQEAQKKKMSDVRRVKDVSQASVIGAGLMGAGIAWALSYRGINVVLNDIESDMLGNGFKSIQNVYNQLKKRRRITAHEQSLHMLKVTPSIDQRLLQHSDLVVEAVVEKLDVKQKVYDVLEKSLAKESIIASNTSSISINTLASKLAYPERFIGMHFFSPVNKMPLVEIIPGKHTSQEVIDTTLSLVKKMKKTAVVVKDCPGFLVNRIFLPYVNEAMYCLQDGASVNQVDSVLKQFGMPVGPLELSDNVGLDIGMHVLSTLEAGYGERMKVSDFALSMFKDKKWLGKKSKLGFYDYSKSKKVVNGQLLDQLNNFQSVSGQELSNKDLLERCLFIMINEAFRCLEENVVEDVSQLDLSMIMGIGFPPFRGGLYAYANEVGLSYVVDQLDKYKRLYGKRFLPCDYLIKCSN